MNPELSPQIEEIILHAMERDPAKRYASAAEMKAELDAPEKVVVTGRAERLQSQVAWKSAWRQYRTIVLSILLPIIFVIAVLLLAMLTHRHK